VITITITITIITIAIITITIITIASISFAIIPIPIIAISPGPNAHTSAHNRWEAVVFAMDPNPRDSSGSGLTRHRTVATGLTP
jgi:uncharacterized RmlC-like cupin family protein